MKTIVVAVINDLVTDQRVYKVCNTLQSMGFNIHLIGRKLKNSLPIQRNYKVTRMKLLFNKGFLFYAEYNVRLFLLLFFTKKEVLLANDLDTLLPNFLISKIFRKPLVYDSHELFTEVPELIHRPKIQKIWLSIEQFIFPKLKDVFTVCDAIADVYKKKYNVEVKVLRNLPLLSSGSSSNQEILEIKRNIKNKKSVLYQGAVNLGRGIALMIDTVKTIDNAVLYIFGDGDLFEQMKTKLKKENLKGKIFLYGKMDPITLKSVTPLFDLGLSLEEDLGMNYKYALPNKIFDYMQAEIPCLVSDLPEMKKIVNQYHLGQVVKNRNVNSIAESISELIVHKTTYQKSLKLAKTELNWEKESEIIQQVYAKFL